METMEVTSASASGGKADFSFGIEEEYFLVDAAATTLGEAGAPPA